MWRYRAREVVNPRLSAFFELDIEFAVVDGDVETTGVGVRIVRWFDVIMYDRSCMFILHFQHAYRFSDGVLLS